MLKLVAFCVVHLRSFMFCPSPLKCYVEQNRYWVLFSLFFLGLSVSLPARLLVSHMRRCCLPEPCCELQGYLVGLIFPIGAGPMWHGYRPSSMQIQTVPPPPRVAVGDHPLSQGWVRGCVRAFVLGCLGVCVRGVGVHGW